MAVYYISDIGYKISFILGKDLLVSKPSLKYPDILLSISYV